MRISYSVENIRRLAEVRPIELRPITVLVGRNSAGKSTYLRSLPLIRQSIETKSSAPILWFGDLVDFGDFNTAISERKSADMAVFSFIIEDLEGRHRSTVSRFSNYLIRYRRPILAIDNLNVRYFVGAEGDKTVLRKVTLEIPNEGISFEITYRGRSGTGGTVTVNGEELTQVSQNYETVNSDNNLFSTPILISKSKDSNSNVRSRKSYQEALVDELEKLLRREVPRISSDDTFKSEVANILLVDTNLEEGWAELEAISGTVSFQKLYRSILTGQASKVENSISTIQKTFRSLQILDLLAERLTSFFVGVGYLGPARAAGERYYRKQELEVSEILPNASNFAMFLDTLTVSQKQAFSEWVEGLFGYGVEVASIGGHISINLKAGTHSVNVTDTGYGVSQMLPVLASVWWASQRRSERWLSGYGRGAIPRTIAIEQPELHLHPAHQAKLADVFAGAVSLGKGERSDVQVNILIETHSEALINRLGELIEDGTLKRTDVQIVIFSAKDDIKSPPEVSLAEFDDRGALKNWPFGFFNYS
ncbi:AAA family ATPase [Sulfitobacter litoralis]|uniref:AAA family ATPase n=1 Tax=Sulfitobacter litoralis TaxID=335975 RepID=UPI002B26F4C5|nr:AAA family ATPase [Sulfitobacter litoralis]